MEVSFAALGLIEILVFLGSTASSPTHDLASLLRAEDYFKARNVAVKPEQLVALALKEPADGKSQLQQLLALRWLGENPAAAKKTAGARAALEQIAAGKKAQDPQGFARLYARQTLARLDGKPVPVTTAPRGSLLEGFAWFPADTNLAAAVEVRPPSATFSGAIDPLRELLAKMLPPRSRKELYRVAEVLGNVRIDRLSLGQAVDQNGDMRRMALRLSGAYERKRLADFLRETLRMPTTKEAKGPKGEPITLLVPAQGFDPAFALVGDSDLLIAVPVDKMEMVKVLEQMLEVRAGKHKSASAGVLAGLVKKTPANARSLLAYDLPEKALAKGLREFQALTALPRRLLVDLTREGTGDTTKQGRLAFHFEGVMKDAAEAKAFTEAADKLKQQGLKALDNPPPGAKIPPGLLKSVRQTLAGLKVEAAAGTVKAQVSLPKDDVLLNAVRLLLGRRSAPPPVETPKTPCQ